MKERFILKRRQWLRLPLAGIAMVGLATLPGCTPALDWRWVQHAENGWKALFPAKPVEVSRSIVLPTTQTSIVLTLTSARIENTLYAVGHVHQGSAAIRQALEEAMLANLQARPADVSRSSRTIHGLLVSEVQSMGLLKVEANQPPVPARLLMRSVLVPSARGIPARVIEIVAVGPAQELQEDDARQFIESLEFLGL